MSGQGVSPLTAQAILMTGGDVNLDASGMNVRTHRIHGCPKSPVVNMTFVVPADLERQFAVPIAGSNSSN